MKNTFSFTGGVYLIIVVGVFVGGITIVVSGIIGLLELVFLFLFLPHLLSLECFWE